MQDPISTDERHRALSATNAQGDLSESTVLAAVEDRPAAPAAPSALTADGGETRSQRIAAEAEAGETETGEVETSEVKIGEAEIGGTTQESQEAVTQESASDVTKVAPPDFTAILWTVPLAACFVWSYWPTLVEIVRAWDTSPDYSHGYLVVPLALYFLWSRRERFPGFVGFPVWAGLALLLATVVVRFFAARWYLFTFDAWSIPLWLAGVVCLLGGLRVLWWSLPAIAFLGFAIPLPFSLEHMLSVPLQRIATKLSSWMLQILGYPAVATGNTIYLSENDLQVAAACSGMRIFIGVFALAFAYCVLLKRSWWEKLILVLSTIPIALVANSTRIVVTGLLYECVSGEAAHKFSHDWAGYLMIPFAALLFAVVAWYLHCVFPEYEELGVADVVRRHAESSGQVPQSRA